MNLAIPELSLVLLIGPSGSGKSTFARRHFRPAEILSSDAFRAMVCDDEANQHASRDAFELLHIAVAKRLAWGRLTVVDATHVQPDARKPLLELARQYHVQKVAIVFNLPEELCQRYNQQRPDRNVPPSIVTTHRQQLEHTLGALQCEHFAHVYVLGSPEEVEAATVERQRLPVNRRDWRGSLDIIGDVHGCFDELEQLLRLLGYEVVTAMAPDPHKPDAQAKAPGPSLARQACEGPVYRHAGGRKVVFVGDLVDRGPNTPEVLRLAMAMIEAGLALCVRGNHDMKLLRLIMLKEGEREEGREMDSSSSRGNWAKRDQSRRINICRCLVCVTASTNVDAFSRPLRGP